MTIPACPPCSSTSSSSPYSSSCDKPEEDNNDTKFQTTGELYVAIRRAVVKVLPDDALQPIRERLAEEIATVLPTDTNAPLSDEIRKNALNFYQRAANILESIR